MTRPSKYRSDVGKGPYKISYDDTFDLKPPKWDEVSDKEFSISFPGTPGDLKASEEMLSERIKRHFSDDSAADSLRSFYEPWKETKLKSLADLPTTAVEEPPMHIKTEVTEYMQEVAKQKPHYIDLLNSQSNTNQQKEEINTMNTRRIVTVQLIDQDKGLPVANSVVAVFNNIVTEDTDQVTIQEVLMSENIAGALKSHNEVRQSTTNLDILNRTGNEVKLQPVKLKDLTWVVR